MTSVSLFLTFDFQVEAGIATLVSVLYSHSVVTAVLFFGTDQRENAHIAGQNKNNYHYRILQQH